MAGLVPAIHAFLAARTQDVDARHRRQVYVVCARQTTMAGHDRILKVGFSGMSIHTARLRKSRIASPISRAWVSSAKWPVSKKRTVAPGMSRLNASAPGGRKNGSFLPHTP